MAKQEITMKDLADKLDKVESGLTAKIDGVEDRLSKKITAVDQKIDSVEKSLSKKIEGEIDGLAIITKHGFDAVDKRFAYLEQGQEDVKLRLDNVAHRFELQELARRVTLIEKKVKLN